MSAVARLGCHDMLRFLVGFSCTASGFCDWQTTMSDDGKTLSTLGFVIESSEISFEKKEATLKLCMQLGCPLTVSAFATAASLWIGAQPFKFMQWMLDRECPMGAAHS